MQERGQRGCVCVCVCFETERRDDGVPGAFRLLLSLLLRKLLADKTDRLLMLGLPPLPAVVALVDSRFSSFKSLFFLSLPPLSNRLISVHWEGVAFPPSRLCEVKICSGGKNSTVKGLMNGSKSRGRYSGTCFPKLALGSLSRSRPVSPWAPYCQIAAGACLPRTVFAQAHDVYSSRPNTCRPKSGWLTRYQAGTTYRITGQALFPILHRQALS